MRNYEFLDYKSKTRLARLPMHVRRDSVLANPVLFIFNRIPKPSVYILEIFVITEYGKEKFGLTRFKSPTTSNS